MENINVCIAVESCYNNNDGAFDMGYFWDGRSVSVSSNRMTNDIFRVNATKQQIADATTAYMADESNAGYNYNKYLNNGRGGNTFVGCKVVLQRSRKAPNKVDLTVVDFYEGGYNSYYNSHESDKIKVTDGSGGSWIVAASCIKEVTQKVTERPFWAVDQSEITEEPQTEDTEQTDQKTFKTYYESDVKIVAKALSSDVPEETKKAIIEMCAKNNGVTFDKFLSDVLKVV